jgi:hypothetical protein
MSGHVTEPRAYERYHAVFRGVSEEAMQWRLYNLELVGNPPGA